MDKVVVFGGYGWIGGSICNLLRSSSKCFVVAERSLRLENFHGILEFLQLESPSHVFCATGVTGRPNVDWCEDHKPDTYIGNVIGPLNLAMACKMTSSKPHLTLFGTGCIYEYDTDHQPYSGIGFKESDIPNFTKSFYSFSKTVSEQSLAAFPNVLLLRIRMPICDSLHPRNFITKITRYRQVVNIPNSMTVLDELLPLSIVLAENKLCGVYNFSNPGVISHNEILDLYTKIIDPEFTYENFTLEDQASVIKAPRSNNELDCSKLQKAVFALGLDPVMHIRSAVRNVLERMKNAPSTAEAVLETRKIRQSFLIGNSTP